MKKVITSLALCGVISTTPVKAAQNSELNENAQSKTTSTLVVDKKQTIQEILYGENFQLPKWIEENKDIVSLIKNTIESYRKDGVNNPYYLIKKQKIINTIKQLNDVIIIDYLKRELLEQYLKSEISNTEIKQKIETVNLASKICNLYKNKDIQDHINILLIEEANKEYIYGKISLDEYIKGCYLIAGGDFIKSKQNKEFTDFIEELSYVNKTLATKITRTYTGIKIMTTVDKDKILKEYDDYIDIILKNKEFLKKNGGFDFSKLIKGTDEISKKFAFRAGVWFEEYIENGQIENTKEYIELFKDESENGIIAKISKYIGNKDDFELVSDLIFHGISNNKNNPAKSSIKIILEQLQNELDSIKETKSYKYANIEEKRVNYYINDCIKGHNSSKYADIITLDRIISEIKKEKNYNFETEKGLEHYVIYATAGSYDINKVIKYLKFIVSLDIKKEDKTFAKILIRNLLKKDSRISKDLKNCDLIDTFNKLLNYSHIFRGYSKTRILSEESQFSLVLNVFYGKITEQDLGEILHNLNTLKQIQETNMEVYRLTNEKKFTNRIITGEIKVGDLKFLIGEFLNQNNKMKYSIPKNVFDSEKIANDYERTIIRELFLGKIGENEVKYIFEKLLMNGTKENDMFNKMNPAEKIRYFEKIIKY